MSLPPLLLRISDVTIEPGPHYETGFLDVSFELTNGDLLLLHVERDDERLPLADAVEGLVAPAKGQVLFLGEDWQRMSADHAAAQRGRVGRLFDDEGWIRSLEVDQNIMLAQRHHTQRTEGNILEEAMKFARLFGLPDLPRERPESVRQLDLRRAACVRAFLGQPALIILEQPVRGVYAELFTPLINAVRSARQRGAAVLWTVTEPQLWNHAEIHATTRARMLGSRLEIVET